MYTEAQLVTFGNYLFSRYGVKFHTTDGLNNPIGTRQVDDADLCNWKVDSDISNRTQLPSKFQHGDMVRFLASVKITGVDSYASIPAEILGIHFYPGKVKYDIEVQLGDDLKSRIYNVDSALVTE